MFRVFLPGRNLERTPPGGKVEWHMSELLLKVGFIVTNSTHHDTKVVIIYNGRANVENRLKEANNTSAGTRPAATDFKPHKLGLKWER